jgi:glycosyltransferase involved in cell wall biosynthesis
MSMQKPLIASRVGGIPEVVKDGETGLLVPSGDAPLLALAIETIHSDTEMALRLAANARREVEGRFTWEKAADQTLRVYLDVLEG